MENERAKLALADAETARNQSKLHDTESRADTNGRLSIVVTTERDELKIVSFTPLRLRYGLTNYACTSRHAQKHEVNLQRVDWISDHQ